MTSTTPSADKVYAALNSEVGYTEGSNNYNIFASTVGVPNNQAWCTTFVSWGFKTAGYQSLCLMSDYSVDQYNWFAARNRVSGYPAVGAVVWLGPGGGDHTAFVYKYDADNIWTVEGNWDNKVQLMVRPRRTTGPGGLDIFQYGYPAYAEGVQTADPTPNVAGSVYHATASLTLPSAGGGTTSTLPWTSYTQIANAAAASAGYVGTDGTPESSKDDVLEYQKALKVIYPSYDYSSGPGIFGPLTHTQTGTYQTSKGYPNTGNPDVTTIEALSQQAGTFQIRDLPGGAVFTPTAGGTTPPPRPWVWSDVGVTGDSSPYPGSVSVVQAALKKEYPTASFTADNGKWLTQTMTYYSKWQNSLGFTGSPSQPSSDANGHAGQFSMTALAEKYTFDVHASPNGWSYTASGNGGTGTTGGTGGTSTGGTSSAAAIDPHTVTFLRYTGGGTQAGWISAACTAAGVPFNSYWQNGYNTAISRESAGDPNACNTYDSNAINPPGFSSVHDYGNNGVGDSNAMNGALEPFQCSRGIAQCIPQTFATNHAPNTSVNIYDPIANIAASINYVRHTYGVSTDGHDLASKVQQFDPNRSPAGY